MGHPWDAGSWREAHHLTDDHDSRAGAVHLCPAPPEGAAEPMSLPAEDVALRWAIGAARRELGPEHPTTRQLVACRVSILIRLGRDAEAASLAAATASTMSPEEAPRDD